MARRDGGDHDTRSARRLPKRPKPSSGKSNRSPTWSPVVISKVCSPIARVGGSSSSSVITRPSTPARHLCPALAVGVRAGEAFEHVGRQLDGLGHLAARAEHALEEGVLDLRQRVIAPAARRQADEDRVTVGNHEQRRLEAAVGPGVAPDLDPSDTLAEEAKPVDAAERFPVDDPQPGGCGRREVGLPEADQVVDVRDETARWAPRTRVRPAGGRAGPAALQVRLGEPVASSPSGCRMYLAMASS